MSEARAKGIKVPPALAGGPTTVPPPARSALDALYRQYWAELCKYINRKFGPGPPDPEDVAQAVFERYAALKDPRLVKSTRAYLYSAARNIVFDHYRKSKVADHYVEDLLRRPEAQGLEEITPEHVLIEKDHLDHISAAILKLPEKQQVVLTLHRYHGATYAQIAAKTGWSIADISRQLARAVKTLSIVRDELEEKSPPLKAEEASCK